MLIDGMSEFACVAGPEFDAHRVDFAMLVQRNSMYRDAEQRSMAQFDSVRKKEVEEDDVERACAVASNHRGRDHRQGDQR